MSLSYIPSWCLSKAFCVIKSSAYLENPFNLFLYSTKNVINRPKRPLSAFFRFSQEFRPHLRASNPNISAVETAKQLGAAWSALSETDKLSYKESFQNDINEWRIKMAEREANLADSKLLNSEQFQAKEERAQKALRRANKQCRILLQDLGRPKMANMNAWTLFLQDRLPIEKENLKSGQSRAEIFKAVSRAWNSLDADEKSVYLERASIAKSEYKQQMKIWNLKMKDNDKLEEIEKAVAQVKKLRERKKMLTSAIETK